MMEPTKTAPPNNTATHTARCLDRETKMVRPSSPATAAEGKATTTSARNRSQTDDKDTTRIVNMVRSSLLDLSASAVDEENVADIALFLQESMSVPNRTYHRMDHVLDVAGPGNAISHLAGLFHDVVYVTQDGGLTRAQAYLVEDVATHQAKPKPIAVGYSDDVLRSLVMSIFELSAEKLENAKVPPAGWNEFLSALVAARVLRPYLKTEQIAQVVTCIEATIPFRHGGIMQEKYERLKQVVKEYGIQLSDDECVRTIHLATAVANVDVENFAYSNPALFLDKTWALLPELNSTLLSKDYSCWDYREAVRKMHLFFSLYLKPDTIFHGFQGRAADLLQQDTALATFNVEIAKRYLSAKLMSATVLCAFSVLTTGDVDLPLKRLIGSNWRSVLVKSSTSNTRASLDEIDTAVYDILRNGRVAKTDFDTRESPLAALLFESLGNEGIQKMLLLESSTAASSSDLSRESAQEILHSVPCHVVDVAVKYILNNNAVSPTAKSSLNTWLREPH